jgi:hypothetical protein
MKPVAYRWAPSSVTTSMNCSVEVSLTKSGLWPISSGLVLMERAAALAVAASRLS